MIAPVNDTPVTAGSTIQQASTPLHATLFILSRRLAAGDAKTVPHTLAGSSERTVPITGQSRKQTSQTI